MTGAKIIVVLAALAVGVITYVLVPNEENLERKYRALDEHAEETISALDECTALVKFFDGLKPVAKKKKELGSLRKQRELLEKEARHLRDSEDVESADARRGLETMEGRYYLLMRDAQDLRARLREMKKYKELLDPLTAANGRLQRSLAELSQVATDPEFLEQANKLTDDSRVARSLAADGVMKLSHSIVDGRPLCEAALRRLGELNRNMRELEESNLADG